ncbi:chemotaxis protein methyltransferase CheR [Marmoricola sp. URHA0025 HA25]
MTGTSTLEAAVDQIAELLHVHIGLRPDPTLRGRLVRAVRDEAASEGRDPAAYADRLRTDEGALQRLLNRVTVQETGFFRHPEQFEVLLAEVLPGVTAPVRIWSAGCANGQEAYSLAMVLEELEIEGTVIATDISTAALDRTRGARYSGRELAGVSAERLARHFTRSGDHWEVNASVRDRVTTLHHNLVDPVPPEVRSCEVVLCRNVLIYLTPEQIRTFLDRVADGLPPTATFLVGAAETIWQVSDRFRATHVGETFVYRRRESAAASPPPVKRPDQQVRPVDAARSDAVTARRNRAPGSSRLSLPAGARRAAIGSGGPGNRPAIEPEAAPTTEALERAAQEAIAVCDYEAAVVAFRKCAYLRPDDPMAQLHLGLALEASGDRGSAQRAFAVARRALVEAGSDVSPAGLEGYAPSELLSLLESKR